MWGLVWSALTIGISYILKNEEPQKAQSALAMDKHNFRAGIVLGIGCSLLYRAIVTHFRVHEYFRLGWYSGWRNVRREKEGLRKEQSSALLLSSTEFFLHTEHGSVRSYVSPETAPSSYLTVSIITISVGREIEPRRAKAVEFYFVLSGKGRFSQEGSRETAAIQHGASFKVFPGKIRWVANSDTDSTEDLVLLRSTDGGTYYSRKRNVDVIRHDPSATTASTMERLQEGFRQVQAMAKEYIHTAPADEHGIPLQR